MVGLFRNFFLSIEVVMLKNVNADVFFRTSGDASLGGIIATPNTSTQENSVSGSDTPVQALELVPGLTTGGLGQGAFLITQPQLNPGITFAAGQIPTDHIIVHTLPIQQVQKCSYKCDVSVVIHLFCIIFCEDHRGRLM